jgi:hypothetical protein
MNRVQRYIVFCSIISLVFSSALYAGRTGLSHKEAACILKRTAREADRTANFFKQGLRESVSSVQPLYPDLSKLGRLRVPQIDASLVVAHVPHISRNMACNAVMYMMLAAVILQEGGRVGATIEDGQGLQNSFPNFQAAPTGVLVGKISPLAMKIERAVDMYQEHCHDHPIEAQLALSGAMIAAKTAAGAIAGAIPTGGTGSLPGAIGGATKGLEDEALGLAFLMISRHVHVDKVQEVMLNAALAYQASFFMGKPTNFPLTVGKQGDRTLADVIESYIEKVADWGAPKLMHLDGTLTERQARLTSSFLLSAGVASAEIVSVINKVQGIRFDMDAELTSLRDFAVELRNNPLVAARDTLEELELAEMGDHGFKHIARENVFEGNSESVMPLSASKQFEQIAQQMYSAGSSLEHLADQCSRGDCFGKLQQTTDAERVIQEYLSKELPESFQQSIRIDDGFGPGFSSAHDVGQQFIPEEFKATMRSGVDSTVPEFFPKLPSFSGPESAGIFDELLPATFRLSEKLDERLQRIVDEPAAAKLHTSVLLNPDIPSTSFHGFEQLKPGNAFESLKQIPQLFPKESRFEHVSDKGFSAWEASQKYIDHMAYNEWKDQSQHKYRDMFPQIVHGQWVGGGFGGPAMGAPRLGDPGFGAYLRNQIAPVR